MQLRKNYAKIGLIGAAVGLLIAATAEAASVLVGRNFHVLVPGRVYRSAQPSTADLQSAARRYGIKTVVNLRGCCANFDWYLDECRTTADLDIAQEDVTFSAGRLPTTYELKRLVEVLDWAEYPILIHCRRGVDRTGLTSALIQLLHEGTTPAAARRELSYRHGHFPWGRTAAMLHFFDLYDGYRGDRPHSPALLRQFVFDDYRPGPASGTMALVEPPRLTADQPGSIRLRATNTSHEPWRMKPGTGAGIHLLYRIRDAGCNDVCLDYAGLFERTVPPGESVELTLAVPRLPAGQYWLQADLLESPDLAFAQLGGDPFVLEIAIR